MAQVEAFRYEKAYGRRRARRDSIRNKYVYEMGVKDLWNILSPLCEKKPLYELQGKTIAIDLSGWIVDSQTAVDNATQPKMHLR